MRGPGRLLLLLLVLVLGASLARVASSRAAGLPCVIAVLCPTTTTTTPAPTPTPTTTTPTTPTPTTTKPAPTPKPTPKPASAAHGRYDGAIGREGSVTVIASSDGSTLMNFGALFYRHGSCSDGEAYTDGNDLRVSHAINRGGAQFTARGKGFEYRHGSKVTGTETLAVRLHFTGTRVSGTVRDSFSSPGFTCNSGVISYTAYRDGTPQAPLKTATAETGSYRTSGASYQVFLPLHRLESFHFPVHGSCSNGATLNVPLKDTGPVLLHGSGFSISQSGPYTDSKNDLHGYVSAHLTGRFARRGSRYALTVRYTMTQSVIGSAGQVNCSASYSGTAYGP